MAYIRLTPREDIGTSPVDVCIQARVSREMRDDSSLVIPHIEEVVELPVLSSAVILNIVEMRTFRVIQNRGIFQSHNSGSVLGRRRSGMAIGKRGGSRHRRNDCVSPIRRAVGEHYRYDIPWPEAVGRSSRDRCDSSTE